MTLNDRELRNSPYFAFLLIIHPAARSLCDSWASCYHHCDQLPSI